MHWAPIVPLIGGFPLGAFKATGKNTKERKKEFGKVKK